MRRVAVPALFALVGCSVDFLSTTPTNPGAPTAPAEVVALAGPDLVVIEGSRVVLAGGVSRALVGAPELGWSQQEGPLVTLSNPSSSTPAFVAPLGPARLVFTLEVSADDVRDFDEIVVDVVTTSTALPAAPRVLALPADRAAALDELVRLEAPWTGVGTPIVSARCPTLTGDPLGRLEGQTLVIELAPRALPCPIVVEDEPATNDGDDAPVSRAGRAAITLWPDDQLQANATRVRAPATVDAGGLVAVDLDPGGRLFVVDGTPLVLERSGERVTFQAPARPGRLTLVGETRVGGSSGGVRVVAIEVGAGPGNRAPLVEGGADLRVRPGARFRIAPVASDDDGDPVEVSVRQVLGLLARQAGGGVGVLVAPDDVSPQTLLFHVLGSDGRAESAIDPVRVEVDPAAENLPPVITLGPELYVTPGSDFVIDGSGATDPDAGLITGWRIAQAQTDERLILVSPAETPSVTLTAGAAGERYRFIVSVTDDGGLESSAEVTVIVEDAGPFVDPARARAGGDGTAARPFAAISDGLLTAARHRFPALHLVGGDSVLTLVPLADGLGLDGGWRFDDAEGAYVQDGPAAVVRLNDDGLRLAGGTLSRLELESDRELTLRLQRRVTLSDVTIGPQIKSIIDTAARVVAIDSTFGPVESGGNLDLEGCTVQGALRATNAETDVGAGTRVEADSISGVDGAVVVSGGVLRVAGGAVIAGGPVGLRVGAGAVAAVAGQIEASDAVAAVALHIAGGTVELSDASVAAAAPTATGVLLGAGTVSGRFVLDVDGDDVVGFDALSAPGSALGGAWTINGAIRGVGARAPDLALDRALIRVTAADANGITADAVALTAVLVATTGDVAVGVVAGRGSLQHVSLLGSGLAVSGAVSLDNALCLAPGGVQGSITFGVVGFPDTVSPAAFGCATCVTGPVGAVQQDGTLTPDALLGSANPFVDRGDPTQAVAFDLAGVAIPQGGAPDLGAFERAAP